MVEKQLGKLEAFANWKRERNRFLTRLVSFALIFYLGLPFSLALMSNIMNDGLIGGVSFAWLYAFLQVIATWLFGWLYWRKAKQLDNLLISSEQGEEA